MPAFVWKGKTRDGKVVSGERVADNKEAVMALLRREQILVSSVKELSLIHISEPTRLLSIS